MHYTKEELDMYRHGDMALLARIACKAHLQSCVDCQKILEFLESEDKILNDLREGLETFKKIEEK